jgi:beta-lactamase class A
MRGRAMTLSRRALLTGAAAGTVPLILPEVAGAKAELRPDQVLSVFRSLPGTVGVKIVVPPARGRPGILIQSNSSQRMFVGSAIKTFVLCETLRQADSVTVLEKITSKQLALNESVWNADSQSFNPPNLTGKVTVRTALEAMICHSDNTATDMCIKHAGIRNVRRFIASAGLKNTLVPDSTRIFFGYILGAKDYKHFTWKDLLASNGKFVRPPLNTVETLASSMDDFVSYYSRALQGKFFKHQETLTQFRAVLSMGDAIWLMPVPLGGSAFVKGGSVDTPGFHAVCVPGGMLIDGRWVYFSMAINWNSPLLTDPKTVSAFLAAGNRALQLVVNAL